MEPKLNANKKFTSMMIASVVYDGWIPRVFDSTDKLRALNFIRLDFYDCLVGHGNFGTNNSINIRECGPHPGYTADPSGHSINS